MMEMKLNKKAAAITAGALGGAMAIGAVAAWIYNSRQMKATRAIKRASFILYHVGTAMRNLSGVGNA